MYYDHVISYDLFACVIVDIKEMLYNLADRKLWHTKNHLDAMRCSIQPCGSNVLYSIRTHYDLKMFSMFSFNRAIGICATRQEFQSGNHRCPLFLAFSKADSY